MKWIDESTKKAVIYVAKCETMTIKVIYGHCEYPEQWIMTVTPDIFKGIYPLTLSHSASEAQQDAVRVVLARMETMLDEIKGLLEDANP